MATTSKTAKSTTAKKPAAKKAAPAKKPAAKKPAAKKTAPAKKPAAKKPAAKKAAPAKKPAVKKPAAKKAAPAKKPAVKKPAAKKAAPAKKPAAAVKKPAAIKKAAAPKAAKTEDVSGGVKFLNLFDAYAQGKLPKDQGYIISSFLREGTAYSIYEVVSYSAVKEIHVLENGLEFISNGKKLHILVEPPTYPLKGTEPYLRRDGESIPKRVNELEIYKDAKMNTIMISKEPNESHGSFTVLRPMGINFALVFYNQSDIYVNLASFFERFFNQQLKVPQSNAREAGRKIAETVEKTMSFKGEYE
ncbi:hypothetical protein AGMMS50293_22280 [Spirochaetia bacterium]|nr:hypothetical protein AGMMS50293_22280 [Spirochaetia bacterium]